MHFRPGPEPRRLVAAGALGAHIRRIAGGRLSADVDGDDLVALARRLREESPVVERGLGVRFEPPFPGVTAGVERVGGSLRLVLACTARDPGGVPLHVVFTTLIPGRRPLVSAAPAQADIPGDWRPLAERA